MSGTCDCCCDDIWCELPVECVGLDWFVEVDDSCGKRLFAIEDASSLMAFSFVNNSSGKEILFSLANCLRSK